MRKRTRLGGAVAAVSMSTARPVLRGRGDAAVHLLYSDTKGCMLQNYVSRLMLKINNSYYDDLLLAFRNL